MKKYLVYLFAVVFMMIQSSNCSYAVSDSAAVKYAVKKYQAGDYSGCIQECLNITYHNPKNAMAYYYLAMSYAQAGFKDKAVDAYNRVVSLNFNPKLNEYAKNGVKCLNSPDECPNAEANTAEETALDNLISAPAINGLSTSVKNNLQKQQLDNLKQQINSGKEVDVNSIRLLNDASNEVKPEEQIAQKKPTEAEVAAALKVLSDAGVNPYSSTANYQNPEAVQLQMLSAFNNNPVSNPTDSTSMLNMIPQMMAQGKSGQGQYSPQLMQAFIMNSLTGNMNTDFTNNDSGNQN